MKIDWYFPPFLRIYWSSKLILVPNLLDKLLYKLETILTVYNVNFKKVINNYKSERFLFTNSIRHREISTVDMSLVTNLYINIWRGLFPQSKAPLDFNLTTQGRSFPIFQQQSAISKSFHCNPCIQYAIKVCHPNRRLPKFSW